ncbi:protein translocase subunit SecD, partial [bacterium]|nr:protein translocase subunit SecD [candidate division CSSED10-310 bacterium]
FTHEEAKDLAIVLRAGALPAPVSYLEERSVGPSLGRDSISKGIKSIIIGGIIVLIFMVVYYKVSGLIANFALLLNVVLITGALGALHATLTLPGIAGIILTIGMAVDANVLIYERIKEELRLGKTIRTAVEAGFSRAFLTILDANVTTLIAAAVLMNFGSGPVRGFAVTLTFGIVSSMFTALFVSRLVFDLILQNRTITTLKI